MAFFNRIKKENYRQESILEFMQHPRMTESIEVMKDLDWVQLERILGSIPTDELDPILSGLSEVATDFDYVLNVPETGMLNLLKGYILLIDAWLERSGNTSDKVSDEQYDKFYAVLNRAEGVLNKYLSDYPNCPLAYGLLFKVFMGQGVEEDELYQLFIRYTRASQGHLSAHFSMAYSLTEQWGGSHISLFSFCRNSTKSNARYAPLIAYAHYQRWFYNKIWESESEFDSYFLRDDVKSELSNAYEAYQKVNVSVYEKRLGENYFAFCFSRGENLPMLRKSLKYIDTSILPSLWERQYENIFKGVNSLRSACQLLTIKGNGYAKSLEVVRTPNEVEKTYVNMATVMGGASCIVMLLMIYFYK